MFLLINNNYVLDNFDQDQVIDMHATCTFRLVNEYMEDHTNWWPRASTTVIVSGYKMMDNGIQIQLLSHMTRSSSAFYWLPRISNTKWKYVYNCKTNLDLKDYLYKTSFYDYRIGSIKAPIMSTTQLPHKSS